MAQLDMHCFVPSGRPVLLAAGVVRIAPCAAGGSPGAVQRPPAPYLPSLSPPPLRGQPVRAVLFAATCCHCQHHVDENGHLRRC